MQEFNRPYRDMMTVKGLWTMEDYMRFVEVFSPLLFMPRGTGKEAHRAVRSRELGVVGEKEGLVKRLLDCYMR